MKPKIFVGFAIMLAILAAGTIIVLGLASNVMLPVYLLLFFIVFIVILLFLIKELLGEKIVIAGALLVLFAISATMLLVNLKTYHEVLSEYGNPNNVPEIQLLQLENNYYSEYANYLNTKISEYQMLIDTAGIQLAALDQLKQAMVQQQSSVSEVQNTTLQSQITVPEDYYIPPQYYGGETND